VRRNRFRRLVREAFRSERVGLGTHDFVVSPKRDLKEPTVSGLREDLRRTLTARPRPARAEPPRKA
jgi:ribonuclease P protein component